MEIFNWNPDFELLEIFPERIYEDLTLLYHGTSVLYSDEIEQNGFQINHSPFSTESLGEILDVLADLGEPSNFNRNNPFQTNFNSAGAIDHFLFHLPTHPISFTASGISALNYANGQSKGGQIVGKISRALAQIEEFIDLIPIRDIRKENLINRYNNIFNLKDSCDEIQNNPGVVYAIKPTRELLENLRYDHDVIFSDANISYESIIAKVEIDFDAMLPENLQDLANTKVRSHFNNPRSIGNFLIKKHLNSDQEE
ncbi:hypothetical protein SAMN05421824_0971 [Hyunsoonleella jejuensis]|uniref:Uncharacterized protein n=1 Tax=Hyunsoonleella jejuensis TaxID=419940 RepID=A0A1H9CPG3_9FLAO|nr:hypothetical protein [Hyunsoonleella jejuensis]SEQ03059.1 hypothetical protein SAMN05421824_0971 [Hyunsoonleella jejuensis]